MRKSAFFSVPRYLIDIGSARIRPLLRLVAVGLAAAQVWAAITSQSMNPDGISYLDIGDAYFRADWQNAINPVWSPFYSWLLGLANLVFKPSMSWQFPTVHLVNFAIFLMALLSFEFMWGKIRATSTERDTLNFPEPLWWTLGYALFIWTSLSLIQIWSVTPDMLMATFVFLAAGLIAQIRAGSDKVSTFLQLGLVLGLGYLSKTLMFMVAWIFLGITAYIVWQAKISVSRLFLALTAFLVISLPFIFLISAKKDKLTFGEVGRLTYARYVNGVPYPHWQGDARDGIRLAHPSRIIHQSPPVYEFAEPIGGTYPITTDPSYWYDGLEIRFKPGGLLARLLVSGLYYVDLFVEKQGVLIGSILALYLVRPRQKITFVTVMKKWALVIPALVAFGLYGMVWVEDRYIGVFVLLFWTDILANVHLPDTGTNRFLLKGLSIVATFALFVNIIAFNLDGFTHLNPSLQASAGPSTDQPAEPLSVARALYEVGVQSGDRVGVIGDGFNSFWARLAHVRIIAELLDVDADPFWLGDDALRQSVLQAFAESGVDAVVAENVPVYVDLANWHQVENSNYYIYVFTKP